MKIGDGYDHVTRAGDLNGDGVCDILLATPGGNLGRWGYVTAFSGSDGVFLRRWRAERGDTRFGQSVASLGDVDGDGVADIAIGVSSPYMPGTPGEVRVFSGSSGKELYRIDQATLFEQSRRDATAVDSARKK